jgi:hypothetical protein
MPRESIATAEINPLTRPERADHRRDDRQQTDGGRFVDRPSGPSAVASAVPVAIRCCIVDSPLRLKT